MPNSMGRTPNYRTGFPRRLARPPGGPARRARLGRPWLGRSVNRVPKWKIEAASAASAFATVNASTNDRACPPARRDHGNRDGLGDRRRSSSRSRSACRRGSMLVSRISPVASFSAACPFHGVQAGRLAPAMGVNSHPWPSPRRRGVDGHDDALGSEAACGLAINSGCSMAGVLIGNLVGSARSMALMLSSVRRPPPMVTGHEALGRRPPDHVSMMSRPFVAGRNVKKDDLVGSGGRTRRAHSTGVARVDQVDEIDALDDAAIF